MYYEKFIWQELRQSKFCQEDQDLACLVKKKLQVDSTPSTQRIKTVNMILFWNNQQQQKEQQLQEEQQQTMSDAAQYIIYELKTNL